MEIPVKLQNFEGPLDLLLHLIEKNKVNIYDIPIVEITNQYMDYISNLPEQTLDVMSEFLVMAATLLDIKSRMLLPPEVTEEGEEIDPRSELVEKLLEYKTYKYLSGELKDRMEDAAGHYYKEASIPLEVAEYQEPVNLDEALSGVTLKGLYSVFSDLMHRQEDRIDTEHGNFHEVKRESVDMGETIRFVGNYIYKKKDCTFKELLLQHPGREYKIVSFLTILELMKEGQIQVKQPETFADISLSWVGEAPGADLETLVGEYE